jgi:hypothetical protein
VQNACGTAVTDSLLTDGHASSSVVGLPFSGLVAEVHNDTNHRGHLEKKNFENFSADRSGCEVLSLPHLFSVLF